MQEMHRANKDKCKKARLCYTFDKQDMPLHTFESNRQLGCWLRAAKLTTTDGAMHSWVHCKLVGMMFQHAQAGRASMHNKSTCHSLCAVPPVASTLLVSTMPKQHHARS
jgi:hypothetical protein